MNWSVWLSSNTPGIRPVLNGCQLPQSQPVICLGVLPCQAENSLKANRHLCAPAETLALGISSQLLNRLTKSSGERVKETAGPKRDYWLRKHLTNTHQLNCEGSWANWSAAPELRTVKYSTMPRGWASWFHIWTCPVMVPGHGTVGPIVWKRAICPGHFRLRPQTQHQIDEGLWWLWLGGVSNNWSASFNFFFNSGDWIYTCEGSTLPLTCTPYPLLRLHFETEPH